ncbi:hypothetical protein KJJ36_14190 [Staphylococcus pseudoxylosus]|uniref:hypothetical protein n=1 Tax=Staphylococcus pseudoxylosus TaxID=2282419 RepID=UPI001F371484|nr:hypothetical protein [Staphylococcus pseudoxylosus]MCE5003518.1 hypothetical protein [Staphylococcus pseudoxylosus]
MSILNLMNEIKPNYIVGIPGSEIKEFFSQETPAIIPSREDEALAIASGLELNNYKTLVAIQSSGAGNIINALASFVLAYDIPLNILISLRGGENEENEAQKILGSSLLTILKSLEVNCITLNDSGDVIEQDIRHKYKTTIFIYKV